MTNSSKDTVAFANTELAADSAAYVEALYEQYMADSQSVSKEWQDYFAAYRQDNDAPHNAIKEQFLLLARNQSGLTAKSSSSSVEHHPKQMAVQALISAYRRRGHRKANLDPLGLHPRPEVEDLTLAFHGLAESDLDTTFPTNDLAIGKSEAKLREIIEILERVYCQSIGYEYMHVFQAAEKRWIENYIESNHGHIKFDKDKKLEILERLTAAEGLEKYLARKYTGVKRFGLEGGESFIPAVHEMVQRAGTHGSKEVVIGMAHRGRLNLLVNILGKKPSDLFDEFDGKVQPVNGSGDVKYHNGFSSNVMTPGGEMHLALAFNPSHLEIVSPVLQGSVRARQARRSEKYGLQIDNSTVLPLVVHGDAALAGQGVNQETFQMSQTRAYKTGGTVHIVINNQVGFTTSRIEDARSTEYCTDVAKMVHAPILHVNGDDPEAVVFASQLAVDYRREFGKDVMLDIFCYRRNGHNESDEPSATQPLMYAVIKKLPTTRAQYVEQLVQEGIITHEQGAKLEDDYRELLDRGEFVAGGLVSEPNTELFVDWKPYLGHDLQDDWETGVDIEKLKSYGRAMAKIPEGFALQRQVAKVVEQRLAMQTGEEPLNWGAAETLAYASLAAEGSLVRITGEDVGRGTFSHRHSELYNMNDGSMYIPLQHITKDQARFATYNSLLSEEAVLAFEYGYATTVPNALIIWEAQFGDFVNGAQVVIDQFISSGETKWQRVCGLTMLLPHGFEGQGPEHSSARLERFLQLCAEDNMQVITPTTPAQIFHALRRQVVRPIRKPLIVMSPKSLLRHPLATSNLEELASGKFETVLPEIDPINHEQVTRLVLCGGKVYYDLLDQRRKLGQEHIAIVRIEQLYPLPEERILAEIDKYPNLEEIMWAQEEPLNQGAWYYLAPELFRMVVPAPTKAKIITPSARPAAAAPATGSPKLHTEQQKALIAEALGVTVEALK
ncbi:2-oxoglutarate dehydrogenase E1 component [Moraxella catarrhalis]|uniref:2-oxoglutarate dehydrogenase E1 component n=5 Tax=Bacteria TaxID=2 RepID=A0A198Y257_MORCA|nr:2-oxoglutarate dehydrogenase E1 component [Moraxella catarrhalis]MPX18675.1 2-oxoglutarate dehydrogenase E1 component [Moraxella catarrhalis]MPX28400.1 2-oxoglutarate dehydrogenase E1 component [Moraxella catarrhalis]MPY08353.1 2-oxoglutarate dehydrogenase E1 component [Moraxella catarrhalis]OAV03370.1 2-oxoglutarate dehydrogenase E1 component [Moraxella catarrhalis]OAV07440.1 2-oxoglutarate dehydrogenase E1 component [Moraxella catarrhalis]